MDTPSLVEALSAAMDARANQIRTALPARVVVYNRTEQTADVRPEVWPDGEEAPIIPTVPVIWPRGGGGYLVFPLTGEVKPIPGDTGLLLACEADIAEWRRTGEAGGPADSARHHLQNAVFLPGLVSQGHNLSAPAGATVLDGAGDLRLGGSAAFQHVIMGEPLIGAFTAWIADVNLALLALGLPPPGIAVSNANLLFNLNNALSGVVKVL